MITSNTLVIRKNDMRLYYYSEIQHNDNRLALEFELLPNNDSSWFLF